MPDNRPTVFVVDDDASVRDALGNLLQSVGFDCQLFASTEQFRNFSRPDGPCCLILDVHLPGANGLDFQRDLARAGISIPIIFITAHGDVPMASRALRGGAVEFLLKPFQNEQLLAAVRLAIERDGTAQIEQAELMSLRSRFYDLTAREREVFELVVSGLTNKEVAGRLGISEVTTKMHRGQAMRKMNAASFADLVRMAYRLKISDK